MTMMMIIDKDHFSEKIESIQYMPTEGINSTL